MERKALKTTEAQRRASLKWEQANNEKITIKFRSDGKDGFTKADLQQRAMQAGAPSLNAWLLQVIRDHGPALQLEDGVTMQQIEQAAARDGMSVNAWIIEAIRDKL